MPAKPLVRSFALLSCTVLVLACDDGSGTEPVIPASPDLGTMPVGSVRVLTFDQASDGLTIPASLASAEYVIIAANTNVGANIVPNMTINGSWQIPTGSAVASKGVPAPHASQNVPTFTSIGGARGASFEARLRQYERTGLPVGSSKLGASSAAYSRQIPNPAKAVVPAVNSTLSIRTLAPVSFDGEVHPCDSSIVTTGTVRAVSTRAIVVSDNTSPDNGFTTADYQAIAEEFDAKIYPTDVGYFGTPTDNDANGGRAIIYYTPSVNKLTPAGTANSNGYVGGFFFAGDLFPASACAASNDGEIFFMLAPDPDGEFGNSFSTNFVRKVTRGTVAHEFQHMINAGAHLSNPAGFEVTWLDEGLAHFAEDAVGRSEAGLTDLQTISVATLNDMDATLEDAFFIQNLSRGKYYVVRPDTTGPIVSEERAAQNLSSRGAAWLLLRYAADWFSSNNNPRVFTKALVTGPDTGVTNLTKRVGVPMDTLLARWLVTLYTDHSGLAGLDAKYNYKSYDMRDLLTRITLEGVANGSYLPINALGNGSSTYTVGVPASSAAYFITSLSTGGARTIQVTNTTGSSLASKGRFYIVRTQ